MKIYLFAFLLLLFQMHVAKFFSVWEVIPDFLTVFIVIFALKNSISDSLKVAFFTGIVQDLISPVNFPMNTISKGFIVLFIGSIKEKFYYSSVFIKFFLILIVTAVDTGLKGLVTYISTGVMDFSMIYFITAFVNFLTFYVVSIFYEIK